MRPVSAGRSALESFGSSTLTLLAGVASGVLAARVLGPHDRGALAEIFFWGQFLAPLATLSLADAIVIASRDQESYAAATRQAYQLVLKLLLVALPIGAVVILAMTRESSTHVVVLALAFWVVQGTVMFIDQVQSGSLRATHKFRALSVTRALLPAFYLFFSSALLLLGIQLLAFVVAQCLALVAIMVLRLYLAQRNKSKAPARDVSQYKLLRSAINLHRTTALALLASQFDKLIVVSTLNPAGVGLYFVATTLAAPVQGFISAAISQIALTKLVQLDPDRREEIVARMLRQTWLLTLLGSVSAAMIAPVVTPLLFSVDYAVSGYIAAGLSLASTLGPVRLVIRETLKSLGDTSSAFWSELAFVAAFPAVYLAIQPWGTTTAVVVALGAAHLLATLLSLRALPKSGVLLRHRDWLVPSRSALQELQNSTRAALKR